MKLEGEQTLLRVYLRNTDKHGWSAAGDVLVERAHRKGLAGATMLRGIFGLDVTGQVLATGKWSLVDHVPLIIEFVDGAQAIGAFLQDVEAVVSEGMATLERAHVLVYRHSQKEAERAAMRMELPGPVAPFAHLPKPEEFPVMKLSEEGHLLRVYIGESDTWHGQPLYQAIVLKAKELGLAGATVLRGPVGYGANSRLHTTKLLELSTDLPILVEIVDSVAKIQMLLPFLDEAVAEGLITIEGVRVLHYRHNQAKARL